MLEPSQTTVESRDGTLLFARYWKHERPEASLVIGHGLGEHGGLYSNVAEALTTSLPLSVLAIDFRGHGRSPGPRGYVADWRELTEDWRAALAEAGRLVPSGRCFALGHSYGGLSALAASLREKLPCDGLIVSNPALTIRLPAPPLKLLVGKILRRVAPKVTVSAPMPIAYLTRDPEMQRRRRADPLAHTRLSAPLFFGMREAAEEVFGSGDRLRLPLLAIIGLDDPVVDPDATREWFDRVASVDKTRKLYPGAVHEPLADLGREQVIADVIEWLRPRIARP